jgi:hypothetical protein
MSGRQAILFQAHLATPGAIRCLYRLLAEAGPGFDVWVIGLCDSPQALAGFGHARCQAYDRATLMQLPYPAKLAGVQWDRIVGDHDLPVLQFFRTHPDYARYWIVEYDVRYTGFWGKLFAECGRSSAGLLGTTLLRREEHPTWPHWPSVSTGSETVSPEHWIKAFLPFAAATHGLLAKIDARYRQGGTGHHEAVWPMVASLAGLGLEDIGGTGPFVPQAWKRRHYWNTPLDPYLSPGSFVYRPTEVQGDDRQWSGRDPSALAWAISQQGIADQLVHPVKD